MSILELKNLSKIYEDAEPLKDINLTVEKGEVISIIGPSGTGKSTLIRCINRLETPTGGQILVDGEDVCKKGTDLTALRKKVGMVFQSFNLFSHKSVIQNVMMPQMDLLGLTKEEAKKEALVQLKRVGLESKANSMPDELSGGQKQRVAIARAIAMHPQILLFDEPTSALDPAMVTEVKNVMRHLASDGMTMLIVTHEMSLAQSISTRVLYIDEGVIYEQGTPEQIFNNPQKEKTREFVMRISKWNWNTKIDGDDFYQMSAHLENFCQSRFMNRKLTVSCELVFEEIFVCYIQPELEKSNETFFEISLRTTGENELVELEIQMFGLKKNVFIKSIDDISNKILLAKASIVKRSENAVVFEINQ